MWYSHFKVIFFEFYLKIQTASANDYLAWLGVIFFPYHRRCSHTPRLRFVDKIFYGLFIEFFGVASIYLMSGFVTGVFIICMTVWASGFGVYAETCFAWMFFCICLNMWLSSINILKEGYGMLLILHIVDYCIRFFFFKTDEI